MTLDVLRTDVPVPYGKAWEIQQEFHARRVRGDIADTLWLLEHPPVITTGLRGEQASNILVDPNTVGVQVVETDRGGEVTYHGPGQLVGYLFVGIAGFQFKVRDFVHRLEEAFIAYLRDHWGLSPRHDTSHTGVWVGQEKITAIGLALKERVTLHGFALNVSTNLDHFDWIVPCGIPDKGVTSVEKLTGRSPSLVQVAENLVPHIRACLGYEKGPRIQDFHPLHDPLVLGQYS